MKFYRAGEAVKLTAVPYRTLDHWIRTKLVTPSVQAYGAGSDRLFTFDELVWVCIVRDLRELGVAPSAIKHALPQLPQCVAVLWNGSSVRIHISVDDLRKGLREKIKPEEAA